MPAHTNSFIVLRWRQIGFYGLCPTVLVLLSQLDVGPSRRLGSTASAAVGWPGAAPWAAWALMLMHWKHHGQAVDALETSWPG